MFCPNCGSQNDDNNKFCWKCGKPLRDEMPVEQKKTSEPQIEKNIRALYVCIPLLAIICLVFFVLANKRSFTSKDESDNDKQTENTYSAQTDSPEVAISAYVKDRYVKVIYDESLNNEEVYCYHIPEIVMSDGTKVDAEDEIYEDMMEILEEKVFPYEDTGKLLVGRMIYGSGQIGDVLSIVMQTSALTQFASTTDPVDTDVEYYVYQIDLKTGKLTSNEELLDQFGIKKEDFYATAKSEIEKVFDERISMDISSCCDIDDEGIQDIRKETLSEERIQSIVPCATYDGKLRMVVNLCLPDLYDVPKWGYQLMDFESDDPQPSWYYIACGDYHKMALYTDSKDGAEHVRSLLSRATVLDIQTFCYDDFDNDGDYEVFITWKSDEGKQELEYLSPEGKPFYLLEGENPDPNILQAGNHKYFRFSYKTSDSSDESRMLILGIKEGKVYQPSISGKFEQFGSTDWTQYYDIPSNAPEDSFFSCTYDSKAAHGNSEKGDYTYYTYDEEERQFVPIS